MGNAAPTATDDAFAEFDGIETLGYRVLGVQPNSPASKSGLVSFLDFLVGANGQMLLGSGESLDEGEEYDDIDFPVLLQENKGKPIELCEWQKEKDWWFGMNPRMNTGISQCWLLLLCLQWYGISSLKNSVSLI